MWGLHTVDGGPVKLKRAIVIVACLSLVLGLIPGAALGAEARQSVSTGSGSEWRVARGITPVGAAIAPAATGVRLGISGTFQFETIYSLKVSGLLHNPGPYAVELAQIDIRYFNSAGKVMRTDSFNKSSWGGCAGMFYVLEPGDVAPFSVSPSGIGGPPPGTVGWDLSATAITCPKFSIWPTIYDALAEPLPVLVTHFSGTVMNDTPYTLDEITVWCVIQHKQTGVIYDTVRDILPGPIAVGASVDYEFGAQERPDNPADAQYTVVAEGRKAPPVTPALRIAGQDRFQTALAASTAGFADGSAPTVIVASGLVFADALSASPLAGAYGAPILLVAADTVPSALAFGNELTRLGCTEVIIVGGTGVVSEKVERTLRSLVPSGGIVRRLAGKDRYSTCAAVLDELMTATNDSPPTAAFVVRGDVFVDALAASPYAWSGHMPVALVRPGEVPSGVLTSLQSFGLSKLWVAGGTGAVSDRTAKAFGLPWERIAGSDRYETAVRIMLTARDENWSDLNTLGIASGTDFPDALVAGPVLGAAGGGLLFSQPNMLPNMSAAGLYTISENVNALKVFGGTAALSGWAYDQAHYLCR